LKLLPLLVPLLLFPACSPTARAEELPPADPLVLVVGPSFREYGTLKTKLSLRSSLQSPMPVEAVSASEGIELPDFPDPLVLTERIDFEVMWEGPQRAGTVRVRCTSGEELFVDLAYAGLDDSIHEDW